MVQNTCVGWKWKLLCSCTKELQYLADQIIVIVTDAEEIDFCRLAASTHKSSQIARQKTVQGLSVPVSSFYSFVSTRIKVNHEEADTNKTYFCITGSK